MRRALAWVLVLPFAAVSVLAGHAAAYALTGAPADRLHGYLEHAPQVVALLVLVGLVGLAFESRARSTSALPIAGIAVLGFACQEHLERLLHTGRLPFLLTSLVFWVGLALQLPLAVAVWLLARRLAGPVAGVPGCRPPMLAVLPLVRAPSRGAVRPAVSSGGVPGRGPPLPS